MSFRKYLLILVKLLGVGFVIYGLDALIFGSIYHPLTYAYKVGSWLSCQFSPISSCEAVFNNEAIAVSSDRGMVVTSQHLASEVGAQILKSGGNAVDAAVAVGYALAVTDPCCGNIGGGDLCCSI